MEKVYGVHGGHKCEAIYHKEYFLKVNLEGIGERVDQLLF